MRAGLELQALAQSEGKIRCVAGAACAAPPWAMEDLAAHLDKGTLVEFGVAMRFVAYDAAAGKRRREKELADALAAAQRDAVALRKAIVERDLYLRCPRCADVFNDYGVSLFMCACGYLAPCWPCPLTFAPFFSAQGCNSLRCRKCGAGFCAVCLKDCGADAHEHHAEVHDRNYFNKALFVAAKRERFLRRVVAAVAGLAVQGEAVQRAVVAELGKADLRDLGITEAEVLAGAEVGKGRDSGKGGGGGWECHACTLINAAGMARCEACGTAREGGGAAARAGAREAAAVEAGSGASHTRTAP